MNYWQIRRATQVVAQGGIIAYPTEAVWGVGCDPFNAAAVRRLLSLKQRPEFKGLILVAANLEQLGPLLKHLSDSERSLISETRETPTTWLIPDPDNLIPSWVKGEHPEVAVRISSHPLVKCLCEYWGGLLVSTSANVSTQPPAMSAYQVRQAFQRQIDYVLPGRLGGYQKPSEIRSLRGGRVLRQGG